MLTKKSLGQHFLRSPHYLTFIADTAKINKGEQILEIGPGEGTLTRELLSRGATVTAVEKDHRLIPILKETFAQEIADKKLFLIEGDILELDPQELVVQPASYKLVANIPYYITGAVIEKFLSSDYQPSDMVLLVQKEVAERIARDKKGSILSLSVKVYGEPRYIKTVPAGAFAPPPSVDSALLAIEGISKKNFTKEGQEQRFFELVHAGFAHKRKLLYRNIEGLLGPETQKTLTESHIPEKARAEELNLEQWLFLSKN